MKLDSGNGSLVIMDDIVLEDGHTPEGAESGGKLSSVVGAGCSELELFTVLMLGGCAEVERLEPEAAGE